MVRLDRLREHPGAPGNAAAKAASLGASVTLVSVLGGGAVATDGRAAIREAAGSP